MEFIVSSLQSWYLTICGIWKHKTLRRLHADVHCILYVSFKNKTYTEEIEEHIISISFQGMEGSLCFF